MAVDGRKRSPEGVESGRRVKQSGAEVGGRMSFPSWASRVASASAMAALALIAAPVAKADVVKTFDLSGSSVTNDTFAGTIDLDFTNNTATSVDVTVDGFSGAYAFNQIQSLTFVFSGSMAVVEVSDTPGDVLSLFFLVRTSNTFQNFVGGAIAAEGPFGDGMGSLPYATGSITPVTPVLSDPPPPRPPTRSRAVDLGDAAARLCRPRPRGRGPARDPLPG
jgi:hypothetical protein